MTDSTQQRTATYRARNPNVVKARQRAVNEANRLLKAAHRKEWLKLYHAAYQRELER